MMQTWDNLVTTEKQTNKWTNGEMDGQMEKWTAGQTNRRTRVIS